MPRKLSRKAKQARLLHLIGLVREVYGMGAWKFTFHWAATRKDAMDPEQDGRAQCTASPEYMEAEFQFVLDELRDDELVGIVAHELIHPLLWPMTAINDRWAGKNVERQEAARIALETVTSWLDRILEPIAEAFVALRAEDAALGDTPSSTPLPTSPTPTPSHSPAAPPTSGSSA